MLALPKESTAILIKITGPIDTAEAPVNPYGTDADNTIIEPNTALSLALNTLPNSRGAWIETPATNGNPFYYRVRVQTKGDPSRRFPHSYVYIDGHTGEISEVFDYQKQGTSTTILNWLHPIHDGSFLNLTGRITWLFSGLAVGVLFILRYAGLFVINTKVKKPKLIYFKGSLYRFQLSPSKHVHSHNNQQSCKDFFNSRYWQVMRRFCP